MATRGNFFTDMIKRFGDNWIVAMTPENVQRSGKRIFREMVKGYIDYQTCGKYFLDPKFLENLIIAAYNELEINTLILNALTYYQQHFPYVANISAQVNHFQCLYKVYSTIYAKLKAVKESGNIGWLADISAILYTYRNHLN